MGTRLPGGAPANHTRIKYSITRSNCHLRLALSLSGIHNISKKKFFPKSLILVLNQHNICTYVSTYKEMAVCVLHMLSWGKQHIHTHTHQHQYNVATFPCTMGTYTIHRTGLYASEASHTHRPPQQSAPHR